ncbi:bifunctional UDP-sugar hydrolase/5'-nucleotidase [Pelagerythrobacter sp.]|uniref:bifunctional metallophosphatase/5'-nucleotidase n=1 Tax=Pelagerythrobacter sp. TaxID=2800702 RepID=UPI0035B48D95
MTLAKLLPLAAALALGACTTVRDTPSATPVTVKIVGLNDFHGNLEPLAKPVELTSENGAEHAVRAGGAAYLASAVAEHRNGGDHSLVIAAGDLIGGSPLVSSLFLDEPTIGAMNRLGLDFNAVGNHEFDRGWRELKRMQEGGCEKFGLRDPCAVEPDFGGADFAFLAANVMTGGGTLFPGHAIRRFGSGERAVAVGVIGLTLKDTPTLVTPSGVEGLTFGDEADAINALIPELEREGADAIVVAIHQGLSPEPGTPYSGCGAVAGALRAVLERLDPRVDLVISGHTHRTYVCDFSTVDPARTFTVSSAGYGGALLTDIALTIDPAANEVTAVTARNVVVQNAPAPGGEAADPAFAAFTPDAAIADYVARYAAAAHEAESRPVGKISGPAPDPGPATEETQLGNLIADAQLFATREAGAQIAFMNNSGVRAAILPGEDGTVTFGDIYAAQPFGNTLMTKTFTGAQLLALLEQQFDDDGFVQTFSASEGFALRYDMGRPSGNRVVSATLDGAPIDPAANYRVTMNSFLAAGGDTFTVFADGAEAATGPTDLDAMESYLRATEMRQLPATGRITDLTAR